jgi:hypothetical protein
MKKIQSILISIMLVFSFLGCNQKNEKNNGSSKPMFFLLTMDQHLNMDLMEVLQVHTGEQKEACMQEANRRPVGKIKTK